MKLTTHPLTPDLWPVFEDLFGENGAAGGCWCMYWRIDRTYRNKPREDHSALALAFQHDCRIQIRGGGKPYSNLALNADR